jgi:hypothetical protein
MSPKFLKACSGLVVVPGVLALAAAAYAEPAELTTRTYSGSGDAMIAAQGPEDGSFAWSLHAEEGISPTDGRFQASLNSTGTAWITKGQFGLANTTLELVNANGASTVFEDLVLEFGEGDCSAMIVSRNGAHAGRRVFDVQVETSQMSNGQTHLEYYGVVSLSAEMAASLGRPELAGRAAGYVQLSAELLLPADAPVRGNPEDEGIVGGPTPLGGDIDIWCSRVGVNGGGAATASNYAYHGVSAGIAAFSTATTACTGSGNIRAEWFSVGTNQARHPLITANLYRLLNGRFEQIGQSCVKHSFCAVDEFTCGTCAADGNCDYLAPGCADTYTAARNGSTNLGLRSNINPQGFGNSGNAAGTHSHPFTGVSGTATLRGRINVPVTDLGNAGAQYLLEVQYITHDEPLANRTNNCSYRRINTTATSFTSAALTQVARTAVQGWQDLDPSVTVVNVDVPGDGRFEVAYKVTDNGNGTWHYEYVVHNQTSHLCANSFSLPIPAGVTLSNVGFRDIGYHSGEVISGTDWSSSNAGGTLAWNTETFVANPNANAIRWGTSYNFRFDASAPPVPGSGTLGLWRNASSINFTGVVPCSAGTFTQQPSSQSPCAGQPASFSVSFPGATGYSWKKDGNALSNGGTISGADTATLTISSVTGADVGSYTCQVNTSCGASSSNAASLSVGTAPGFTSHPANQSGATGDTIVLSAAASGSPTYTWSQDGNPVSNGPTGSGSTISGATSGTLTITNAQPSDGGSYVATATNGCGNAPSNAATVEIGCPADFNGDGGVDGDDVIGFFAAWDINDIAADFNNDGSVDGDDVIGFFGNWDTGC